VHIVALLTDRGIPCKSRLMPCPSRGLPSSSDASYAAGASIVFGPCVALCFFVLPMAGIALLISELPYPMPLIGAAHCGAGIGAEIELMAFFIGRYFGLKAYGKIYGSMFMLFNIGTGLGPALSGRVRQVSFLFPDSHRL
jgi:hypothetical protein